jgi:hypothetical protein
LATLVHSPTLASVNIASHQGFVFWSYEIVEWAPHDGSGRKDTVVGAILDVAVYGEAIKDKKGARGLGGKMGITRGPVGKKIVYGRRLRRAE